MKLKSKILINLMIITAIAVFTSCKSKTNGSGAKEAKETNGRSTALTYEYSAAGEGTIEYDGDKEKIVKLAFQFSFNMETKKGIWNAQILNKEDKVVKDLEAVDDVDLPLKVSQKDQNRGDSIVVVHENPEKPNDFLVLIEIKQNKIQSITWFDQNIIGASSVKLVSKDNPISSDVNGVASPTVRAQATATCGEPYDSARLVGRTEGMNWVYTPATEVLVVDGKNFPNFRKIDAACGATESLTKGERLRSSDLYSDGDCNLIFKWNPTFKNCSLETVERIR